MRKCKDCFVVGLAIAALTTPVAALGADPAASNVSLKADLATSRVYAKVGSAGRLGHEHGIIGRLSAGSIDLGGSGAGELTFDMRTFNADDPEARRYVGLSGAVSGSDQQKTNENMKGPHVLDVAKFPTASFAYTAAAPLDGQAPGDPGRYRLTGKFTLHGATQPLVLDSVVERTDVPGVLRMRCAFAILQSQYRMTPYSALGGLVSVADRLEIWGDVVIKPSSR
ncbi:MAG: YceI family protein [Isosphaeraceae bacterium]|nr:YceI family protein [Isosphaeraceae bacterium]